MTARAVAKIAYTVHEAAELTPWSHDVIRKAIRATDPTAFPPPLKAKRGPRGQYIIRPADLEAWLDSFEDA